jgi:hypothetical protein
MLIALFLRTEHMNAQKRKRGFCTLLDKVELRLALTYVTSLVHHLIQHPRTVYLKNYL